MTWIDDIEQRANAATEGPWEAVFFQVDTSYPADHYSIITARAGDTVASSVDNAGDYHEDPHADFGKDAEFIAHAREDIPALLAAVRERDNTIARARAVHAHVPGCGVGDCNDCTPLCENCGVDYPCPTIAALDPQETE